MIRNRLKQYETEFKNTAKQAKVAAETAKVDPNYVKKLEDYINNAKAKIQARVEELSKEIQKMVEKIMGITETTTKQEPPPHAPQRLHEWPKGATPTVETKGGAMPVSSILTDPARCWGNSYALVLPKEVTMKTRDLLTLALLGGGAYLVYRGMRAQQLFGEAIQTGLVPVTPPEKAVEEPPTQVDKERYVPYVPPKKPPQGEPIKPYEEPSLPKPPSGLTIQGMLRQFFSYLSLYSMYGEREYKYRYEEIMPQLLAVAGDKKKVDVVDASIIDVLTDRYYVAKSQPIKRAGWGGESTYEGFVIWDKKTKKRYVLSVQKSLPAIEPSKGPSISGDLTVLNIANRMMDPNISVGELIYNAVSLSSRVKMPLEVFALPTWSATHKTTLPSGYVTWVKLPVDWFQFWIVRGYKPRPIKMPELRASSRHPIEWYVIETERKVSGSMQNRLLTMLKEFKKVKGKIVVAAPRLDRRWRDLLIQFETLLSI